MDEDEKEAYLRAFEYADMKACYNAEQERYAQLLNECADAYSNSFNDPDHPTDSEIIALKLTLPYPMDKHVERILFARIL